MIKTGSTHCELCISGKVCYLRLLCLQITYRQNAMVIAFTPEACQSFWEISVALGILKRCNALLFTSFNYLGISIYFYS